MRSLCHYTLVAFVLLRCAAVFAAPYPTVEQLRTAIEAAAEVTAAEGLALKMADARDAGVTLPLMAAGLDLTDGECLVFYNPVPEAALRRFFDGVAEQDLPLWLNAIAVHETTHCIEQREAYVRHRFAKVLPPEVESAGMTVQGYLGVVKSGAVETWAEALADIASVLYLQQTAPDRWLAFAQGIAAMRRELAAKWPDHDTSPWLDRLVAARAEPPPPQGCFEAAFALRRRYAPAVAQDASSARSRK